MKLLGAFLLLVVAATTAQEVSRTNRIAQINAKIAGHQREIDRLEEEKRRLLDLPDAASGKDRRDSSRTFTGPRNGRYRYDAKGRKVYDRKPSSER